MGTADSVARRTRTRQNASGRDRLLFAQSACTEMAGSAATRVQERRYVTERPTLITAESDKVAGQRVPRRRPNRAQASVRLNLAIRFRALAI